MMKFVLLCLFLFGCSSAAAPPHVDESPATTWYMHHDNPTRWAANAVPLLVVVQEDASMWFHHVDDAAELWNRTAGCQLFRVSPEPSTLARILESNDTGIIPVLTSTNGEAFTRFGVLMNGRFVSMAILLPPDVDLALYPSARFIVEHELGHSMGLAHDVLLHSLMFPSIHLPPPIEPTIQNEDIEALRAWYCQAAHE